MQAEPQTFEFQRYHGESAEEAEARLMTSVKEFRKSLYAPKLINHIPRGRMPKNSSSDSCQITLLPRSTRVKRSLARVEAS